MKSQEAVIRIVGKLDLLYGNVFEQAEVRQIIEEVLYDYHVTQKETLPAIIDNMNNMIFLYLATKRTEGLSDNSIKQYGRTLGKFANHMRKDVENITAMDIRMYIAAYASTGVKNATIATHTNIFRGFFKWLENEDYILKNPMVKIKTVKVEKMLRDSLTKEEFEILRTGAETLRQKALLELLYSTGCRLEEVEQMKKSDIDWQHLRIKVIGKGNKQRMVYLNATAHVHLRKYLMSRLDNCNAVFVTERRPYRLLGRDAIYREIKIIMEQSGLQKNVYPHLIRHTFSTHMLNAGMDVTVLQEILGHESLDTTMVYSKMSNESIEYEYRKYS